MYITSLEGLENQEVVILRPVLKDIYSGIPYTQSENPLWNHEGAILTVLDTSRGSAEFSYQGERMHEGLFEDDFREGYVALVQDITEEQNAAEMDPDVLLSLL